jgi:type II secretory pathway pseudopilin PulG
MAFLNHRMLAVLAVVVPLAGAGCTQKPNAVANESNKEKEQAVRAAFAALQAAVKAENQEKLWDLLDNRTHAELERRAQKIREAYDKADDAEKSRMAATHVLPGAELAKLTGSGFLKSKQFLKRYDELPECKILRVIVSGEKVELHYGDESGDDEILNYVWEEKAWKAQPAIPE